MTPFRMNVRYEAPTECEVVEPLGFDSVELVGPGNECTERLYSAEGPCAGPHHICQEMGEHDEHECFCGFTWGEEDIGEALDLSRVEFTTFVRFKEGLP